MKISVRFGLARNEHEVSAKISDWASDCNFDFYFCFLFIDLVLCLQVLGIVVGNYDSFCHFL